MSPTLRVISFAVTLIGSLIVVAAATADSPDSTPADDRAAEMVRSALRLEADGDAKYRGIVLEAALHAFGDYAPARWHNGYVRVGDDWLTLAEAEAHAAADAQLADYARNRVEFRKNATKAELQLRLGEWCLEQRLYERARCHYAQVLHIGSRQEREEAARKVRSLGLDEIRAEQQRQLELTRRGREAWQQWTPVCKRLAAALAAADEAERQSAVEELSAITDPEAIPALEAFVSTTGDAQALAVIEHLARLQQHAATLSLARHSVFCPSEEVRTAAVEQLVKRPLHDYAPWLLAGLATPVDSQYEIDVLPDGSLAYMHDFHREGANRNFVFRKGVFGVNVFTDVYVFRRQQLTIAKSPPQSGTTPDRFFDAVFAAALTAEESVEARNERAKASNERIVTVLSRATGQNLDADPLQWWDWWNRYNELQTPGEKPTVVAYGYSQTGIGRVRVRVTSCFPRGTTVWTETGAAPIERVQVGDRVLSQDADTGELAYKTVLATTLRQPSPIVKLRAGGAEVRATLGHPFWVSGHGWKMAKQLEVGDNLHGAGGMVAVESVEESPDEEAFNLIVEDASTYFVGEHRLLVHDNTPRRPTLAIVPGLARAGH